MRPWPYYSCHHLSGYIFNSKCSIKKVIWQHCKQPWIQHRANMNPIEMWCLLQRRLDVLVGEGPAHLVHYLRVQRRRTQQIHLLTCFTHNWHYSIWMDNCTREETGIQPTDRHCALVSHNVQRRISWSAGTFSSQISNSVTNKTDNK